MAKIKDKRKEQNKEIQSGYDVCKDYKSKLVYIYNILLKTQKQYLQYKGNDFLNDEYLNYLLQELETIENTKAVDEKSFFDFVNSRLVKPLNSGHVYLKSINKTVTIVDKNKVEVEEDTKKLKNETRNKNIVVENIGRKTLYIKIKSFNLNYFEEDKKTFEEIAEYLNDNEMENIIFDIRGNGGGTDEYFEEFKIFTNKDINYLERFRDLLSDKNYNITYTAIPKNSDAKEYNRYLLVDNQVFSTAEKLTMISKTTGFAKVIGEDTAGEGSGFTPFSLNILNKDFKFKIKEGNKIYKIEGVVMNFPIEAPINENGEIDYEEHYNTKPDIRCDGEDALKKALEDIDIRNRRRDINNAKKGAKKETLEDLER